MTDIEGFLTIYGHSDNLLNNNIKYLVDRNKRANRTEWSPIWSLIVSITKCSIVIGSPRLFDT